MFININLSLLLFSLIYFMNYTLNQLQIFLKIVKTKSITKASEALNLTQPAVSIQLKKLQDQFEIPLTEIVGKKIHITEFGSEIAASVEKIMDEIDIINNKTSSFQGHLIGKLRISVVSTGKYVMPFYISDFIKENPNIELSIDVTNQYSVTEQLKNNEIDFGLVSTLPKKIKVDKLDLIPNKIYLVGLSLPKQTKKNQPYSIFQDNPLIFREQGSGTRQTMEQFLKKNKITVLKKIELTSNEAVKQALLAGLGFSIMPIIGIKNELINEELQLIPFKGLPIRTNWSLIWVKGKKNSPVCNAFIDFLNKNKHKIFDEKFKWYEQF